MRRSAFIVLCVLAVICAGWFLRRQPETSSAAVSPAAAPAPSAATTARLNERRAAEAQVTPGALSGPAPVASPEEKEKRLDSINEAATTYAPEGIDRIKPFLLDPDPEIRTAAKDGLIVLGESGAAYVLRAAAKQLKDPREAAVYLEAADFLELPSWSDTEEAQVLAGKIAAPAPEEQPAPEQAEPQTQQQ